MGRIAKNKDSLIVVAVAMGGVPLVCLEEEVGCWTWLEVRGVACLPTVVNPKAARVLESRRGKAFLRYYGRWLQYVVGLYGTMSNDGVPNLCRIFTGFKSESHGGFFQNPRL